MNSFTLEPVWSVGNGQPCGGRQGRGGKTAGTPAQATPPRQQLLRRGDEGEPGQGGGLEGDDRRVIDDDGSDQPANRGKLIFIRLQGDKYDSLKRVESILNSSIV